MIDYKHALLEFLYLLFYIYILYIKISKPSAAPIAYQGSNPYAVFKPKWCITIVVLGVTTMLTLTSIWAAKCARSDAGCSSCQALNS